MKTHDVTSIAQKLIQFPSVTPEVSTIIAHMETRLKALGFHCEVMTFQSPGRPPVANLFARFGTQSPHLCFAGHVDVVPVGTLSDWKYPPFSATIEGDTLYGRGAVDMKGAIAAFIAAMSHKIAAGPLNGSISLLITGDEEGDAVDGSVRVLESLKASGQIPDVCIVGEPTSEEWVGDTIKIGRRGSLSGRIIVNGRQGHVAYPQRAINPVRHLVNFLADLQKITWDKGNDFFDPSNLEITAVSADNIASNVIPQNATALFNIRYNNLHQRADLMEAIKKLATIHCPDFDLTFNGSAEPFLNKSPQWESLVTKSVQQIVHKTPHISTSGGTSDARFIQAFCPVLELGLFNKTAHQIDENVSVEDLKTLEKIYSAVLDNFFVV